MMPLAADVVQLQHRISAQLALEREIVLDRIRAHIPRVVSRQPRDRQERRPVHRGVGMARRRPEGGILQREPLPLVRAGRQVHKGIGELRRLRTDICASVRSVARHHSRGDAFDRREEAPNSRAQA